MGRKHARGPERVTAARQSELINEASRKEQAIGLSCTELVVAASIGGIRRAQEDFYSRFWKTWWRGGTSSGGCSAHAGQASRNGDELVDVGRMAMAKGAEVAEKSLT